MRSQRSVTGWGYVDQQVSTEEIDWLGRLLSARFPGADLRVERPVALADVELPPPRLQVPDPLSAFSSTTATDRCLHARGRSYQDAVAAFRGQFETAPDVVAKPRNTAEVAAVLAWCADANAACVPFGGGTSVVGGVTPPTGLPTVTLQLRSLNRVLEVDRVSRAAQVQAGVVGPDLERQLRPHGLAVRFFPQSFELSTLGGWIATRAGGHYATRLTHIDDLVESLRAVTPSGEWVSRRVPASGAGPSPDRLLLGSEGILGVITDAWIRLQDRPRQQRSATMRFADFSAGAEAVRALAQSGLEPANCRLLDPLEAALGSAGDGVHALLLVAFESPGPPVDSDLAAAIALCRDHGGEVVDDTVTDPARQWRSTFLRAPYLRDGLIAMGVISETFETAITWDRFSSLHTAVTDAVERVVKAVCGDGLVSTRITHAYPDGAAPYFTVIAPGRRGSEPAQWAEIKAAASDAVMSAGGTITHHHAVGRDHRSWYDRQRPGLFAAALRAAKEAVDPAGILNPGVLLDGAVRQE